MAEYWKSTPRYWCKYCTTYVRDTKLERQNHEATAKHQGAIKRSLRDLHRGKEREEREKERAKREIDRLNGVVSGPSSSSAASRPTTTSTTGGRGGEEERKRQVEQLASLGVNIPDQFRGDLAMAGEWTVTSTTVVPDRSALEHKTNPDAIATGVLKRERTEEELETEEAVKGLFKKPRRWGRDSKTVVGQGSEDLDALLGGGLLVKKKEEEEDEKDGKDGARETQNAVKEEPPASLPSINHEHADDHDAPARSEAAPAVAQDKSHDTLLLPVKTEDDGAENVYGDAAASAVVFKKRKHKNVRQK